jgi:aspartyl-tRNA(Asn)/glutamyl-tRNA(Gln) amidotransferase subunit A
MSLIRALHQQLIDRTTTSVALTQAALDSMAKNESNGAYLTTLTESALAAAAAIDARYDAGEDLPLLAGIPGAIKDNMCMAGVRTTAASKMLDNYIAPYNAGVVDKLSAAGAVIVGKTNMDEFAMGSSTENSAYQKTKNPVNPAYVSGGSSGGSAATVAEGDVVWSLGSDTGGSIRTPAAFCGLVGVKPTYGRVSRAGLIAMASSLDQIGPFATCVEDAAIVLSAIIGTDPKDATAVDAPTPDFTAEFNTDLTGIRVGVPTEYFAEGLPADVRAVNEAAIEHLRKLGATITPVSLPNSKYALPVYYILQPAEVSSNLARMDGIRYGMSVDDQKADRPAGSSPLLERYLDSRHYGLGAETKKRIMLGTYTLSSGYYDAYYAKAQKVRALVRRDFEQAFESVDVIYAPSAPDTAWKFGEKSVDPLAMYLADIYTVTANLAGLPAMSQPIGTVVRSGDTLPLGGQLLAKWWDESTMLRVGYALEQSLKAV